MSTRTSTLALEVVSDVADAATDLGRVESAAEAAAGAIDKLQAATDGAGAGLDKVSGAADGLDSTAAAATGAMGALASGFELAGFDGAAESLQEAAMATDFLSGVGQAAALATQAQAAATKGLTAAQRVLNVVMRTNPLGLLLVAGLAVAGLLTLLYSRSETFRSIVQAAGRAGKAAFDTVSTAASAVVSWVRDRIPGGLAVIRDKAASYVRPATDALGTARDAADAVVDWVGRIPAKFGEVKDKAEDIAGAIAAPFLAVRDAIQGILDKIAQIHVPDIHIPFTDRRAVGGGGATPSELVDPYAGLFPGVGQPQARVVNHVTVQGAVDPHSTARQISELLRRYNLAVS